MNRNDDLIAKYLNDSFNDREVKELEEWLRSDTVNLRELATALARDEQLRRVVIEAEESTLTGPTTRHLKKSNSRQILRWMLTASLVVAVSWFFMPNENSASMVTFEGGSGAVSLKGESGIESGLAAGETFAAGTLLVGGVGTRAKFSYADGSQVTLAGGSELKFANRRGKQLELYRGTLAAKVAPQMKRTPLVILTPTAEAVSLETSLIIDAAGESTLLHVNGGEVQLRRLADDESLIIAQNQQVYAEKEPTKPLQAEPVEKLGLIWTATPKAKGNIDWWGKWTEEGILKAIPREIYRKDLGSNETHYHAGAHNDFPGLVRLEKKSAVRIRFRINKPINVGLFLSTHSTTWNFTGNFQAYIEEHKAPADSDGWRTATVPIESFHPMRRTAMAFKPGAVAATLYATTYGTDAGLEVAKLEVVTIDD